MHAISPCFMLGTARPLLSSGARHSAGKQLLAQRGVFHSLCRGSPAPQRHHTPPLHSPGAGAAPKASTSRAAMAFTYRQPIMVPPRGEHTATVIMLHGLGDSGDGWAGISQQFAPVLKHVKFIFPHAPLRPITVNMGMRMPGWYDIASLSDINQREDKEGLHESQRYIEQLVQAEVSAGVPTNRVVVAGFSQGGAVALMALRERSRLAGIVGLSTYLPLRNEPPVVAPENKDTPVLQCHGDADQVVAYHFGLKAAEQLREAGCQVEFKTYNGMGHGACDEELQAVLEFIKKVVP